VEVALDEVRVMSGTTRQELANAELAEAETEITLERGSSGVRRGGVGRSVGMAVGLVAAGNLMLVTVGSVTGRWVVFGRGWPAELFLVACGLSLIMATTRCIWLLIPTSVVAVNAALMTYSSLTGAWRAWRLFWLAEPWSVAVTVILAIVFARNARHAALVSRVAGWAIGVGSALASIAVPAWAVGLDLVGRLLGM
jgi:hypothetical protein